MRTFLPIGLLLLSCNVQAHISDADFCRNGLFPREQEHLSLGVVQGQPGERVHFFDDYNGCPSKGATCMRAAYLVPGNEVLVGKSTADWTCVWYQGRKREFVSWVPRKNVAIRPAAPVHPVRGWVGLWSDGAGTIRISASGKGDRLHASSRLRWEGGRSPEGERRANFGGMNAVLEVRGSRASASDGDCQVTLTRVGNYLVADDNGECGGMNVRHTGVYFKS